MTGRESTDLDKCIVFLRSIGINVHLRKTPGNDFLPGFSIHNGELIIDKEKVLYPGDILHEAAHIAVVPREDRASLNAASIAARPQREAEEMCAITWSYAAAVHLKLELGFVFHKDGYKGGGSSIAENFIGGRYIGLPMLQWIGLAADEKNAAKNNLPAYPGMIKWLRD